MYEQGEKVGDLLCPRGIRPRANPCNAWMQSVTTIQLVELVYYEEPNVSDYCDTGARASTGGFKKMQKMYYRKYT